MSELAPLVGADLLGIAGWSRIDVVDETGSTNVDLAARVRGGDIDRAVLIAEFQSAGRGRHARVWTAPPRTQLSISVVLPLPGVDPVSGADREVGWVPLLTGLAAVAAVAPTGVGAQLKWPNDVMVGEKKLAGILAELVFAPSPAGAPPLAAVVIGMGLNVGLAAADFPTDRATSIRAELGERGGRDAEHREALDRTALARRYLTELDRRWEQWLADPTSVTGAYRGACSTIGQRVRIELPGVPPSGSDTATGITRFGTAVDVTAAGNIVIRADDGTETAYAAGDVTHLRPVDPAG